jgi:P4 family phage/plasmid primase-like protien
MKNNDQKIDDSFRTGLTMYDKIRIFIGQLLLNHPREQWKTEVWPLISQLNIQQKAGLDEATLKQLFDSVVEYKDNLKTNEREKLKSLPETLQKGKIEGVYAISDYLISKHYIVTTGNRDNTKEIYIYKNGVYRIDHGLVKKEISNITLNLATSHIREEIIKDIKDRTYIERNSFNVNKNLINLKNGVYDLENKEFLPHLPQFLFLHQFPIAYDRDADCPKIKEFLNQILDDDSVSIIQEWLGYCLYRSYFAKKAIIFLGERDTGKTTLIRIMTRLLGEENISNVSLQKLSSDKFALSNLFQKYANIYDDLSFKDINDNGIFKMLTGGGNVTGEKKFGDLFTFNNHAKLTFSANKIPKIKDTDDDAYFSRWILIRFEHKADKPDKFLLEKMSTETELSGLFNFALDGLFRLLENQDFSFRQTPDEIKKEMCMSASSLAQFVYGELVVSSDPNDYITKDNMLQAFVEYASRNDLPIINKEALGKNIHKFIPVSDGRKSLVDKESGKTNQVPCWIGVKFKNTNIIPSAQIHYLTAEESDRKLFEVDPG